MKISIITAVFNNVSTIRNAIESVLSQHVSELEYIIIDGNSGDGTKEIVESYGSRITKFISEVDNGLYDAINKGLKLATGEIIGILNADDFYLDEFVLQKVVNTFESKNVDSVFGNIRFVSSSNLNKTIRYISGRNFIPSRVKYGFMPPHPTIFIKRRLFEEFGLYKTDYRIAADFELVVRLFNKKKISYEYLDLDMIKMRLGGKSTRSLLSNFILTKESHRACVENGVYTNPFLLMLKYPIKIFEFIFRGNSFSV